MFLLLFAVFLTYVSYGGYIKIFTTTLVQSYFYNATNISLIIFSTSVGNILANRFFLHIINQLDGRKLFTIVILVMAQMTIFQSLIYNKTIIICSFVGMGFLSGILSFLIYHILRQYDKHSLLIHIRNIGNAVGLYIVAYYGEYFIIIMANLIILTIILFIISHTKQLIIQKISIEHEFVSVALKSKQFLLCFVIFILQEILLNNYLAVLLQSVGFSQEKILKCFFTMQIGRVLVSILFNKIPSMSSLTFSSFKTIIILTIWSFVIMQDNINDDSLISNILLYGTLLIMGFVLQMRNSAERYYTKIYGYSLSPHTVADFINITSIIALFVGPAAISINSTIGLSIFIIIINGALLLLYIIYKYLLKE